jgi:hypothetical protein
MGPAAASRLEQTEAHREMNHVDACSQEDPPTHYLTERFRGNEFDSASIDDRVGRVLSCPVAQPISGQNPLE